MGIFDTIKDTVDDAVEAGREAAEDVAEATGTEKQVDKVEDEIQERTGVDLGGSGGGPDDPDVDNTGRDDRGVSDADGGRGGTEASGSDAFDNSSGDSPSSGGGSSSGSRSSGSSGGGSEDLESFRETLPGNRDSSQTVDSSERLRNAVNKRDAADRDIVSSRPAETGIFENSYERSLSYADYERGQGYKEFSRSFSAGEFRQGQSRFEDATDAVENVQNQIDRLRESDADRFRIDTNGPESGGVETVSKDRALEILQSNKQSLEGRADAIASNQFSRLQNVQELQDRIVADNNTITKEEASQIAENRDLSSEKDLDIRFFGRDTGLDLSGSAADAATTFDAFTSGGGEASLDILAASVDQYFGDDDDRTVEQVAERSAILAGQRVRKEGFNPVDEGVRTLTSVPGSLLTAYAGGAAFSGATKAVSQAPRVGSAASSALKVGGVAGGAYFAGKQGQKALNQAEQGNEGRAVVTAGLTGAELYGFAKGAAQFASRYGPRVGSSEIDQTNFLRQTGKDSFEGSGGFQGRSVIVDSKFRSPLTRSGFRPPLKTSSQTIEVSGRYGLKGGEDYSDAVGRYQVDYPDGEESGVFESLSRQFDDGVTDSGKKYTLSSDTSRFRTESRLFMNQRDVDSTTKAVVQSRGRASQDEVLDRFDDVYLDTESPVQKVSLSSTDSDSSVFTSTENYLVRKYSDGGGGASSSGSGGGQYRTAVGGDGFASSRAGLSDLVSSKARSYAVSQRDAASTGIGVVPGTGGSGGQSQENQMGMQASAEVVQRERTRSEQSSEEKVIDVDRIFAVQRALDRLDFVQPDEQVQVTETGSGQGVQVGGSSQDFERGVTSQGVTRAEKIKDSMKQGFRNGLEVASGQSQNVETFSQVNGQGVSTIQSQRFSQSLQPVQASRTNLREKSMLETGLVQSPVQTSPPMGSAGTTSVMSQEFSTGRGRSSPGVSADVSRGGIRTDWFSANLVEQKTGEEAVFPSRGSGSVLTGVKTVQERTGQVQPDKILDNNDNGGMNVW